MINEPLYQKIYRDLYDGIKNGKYRTGDRLPSEKELSEAYEVSRITSKKALEVLADQGYVMRKPGKGTFVIQLPAPVEEAELNPSDEGDEQKQPRTIGVVMDSFGTTFGPDIIRGMEFECRRRGFLMALRFTYGSMELETQAINDMVAAGSVGILLMCTQGESYNSEILKLHLSGYPMILFDRSMQGISIPVVETDNYKAAMELTNHLISEGHKRICFLSHSHMNTTTIAGRFSGYLNAMSANGLVNDESLCLRDLNAILPKEDEDCSDDDGADMQRLSEYIDAHPDVTAFLAAEFGIAVMLYTVLANKGLKDKKEIAFFDGYDEDVNIFPKYPHIIQNQYQMGVTAVSSLVHMLRGEKVPAKVVIPHFLVS